MKTLRFYNPCQIPKAIIGLKFKIIDHALEGDNSYSENRQFIKKLN